MTDPTPAPGAPAADEPTTTPAGPDPNEPVDVASLPPNVQKLITDLRKEVGASRTNAKAKAAEEARSQLLTQISQALGLEDTPNDPAVLTEQLAAAQEAVADAQLENHVFRRAYSLGVNGDRLLDSLTFRKAVDDLPDDGFEEALDKLISEWADREPSLRLGGRPNLSTRPVENLRSGALPASDQAPVDADAWIRRMAGIQ
jgi:hypothetical protein